MCAAGDVEENAVAAVGRSPRTPAAAPFGEADERGGIARRIGLEDCEAGAIGLGIGERQAGLDPARNRLGIDRDDKPPVTGGGGGDERAPTPLFSSPPPRDAGVAG